VSWVESLEMAAAKFLQTTCPSCYSDNSISAVNGCVNETITAETNCVQNKSGNPQRSEIISVDHKT